MSNRFTGYTFEKLLEDALARVPDTLDKREGSIIYDALAPACYTLAEFYLDLGRVDDITYADTSVGIDLTRRCAERGVIRYSATQALRKGVFNMNPPVGSRFRLNDTTYVVTETLPGFEAELLCEQTGVIGNQYSGAMLPIDYIVGLITANLTTILIPGEDEEADEALRTRYFENLSSQAYGGNVADYKEKTKAIAGVGGVKVLPVWNGGGTVKLQIIDSTFSKPSTTLVDDVQTIIDPVVNGGEGLGLAPIGHVVTVEGVNDVTADITFTLTYANGYTWLDVEPAIISKLEEYLLSLRQSWENEDALIVRISQVESAVLSVQGIVDVTGTTLNTVGSNLTLTSNEIPVLGAVSDV